MLARYPDDPDAACAVCAVSLPDTRNIGLYSTNCQIIQRIQFEYTSVHYLQ